MRASSKHIVAMGVSVVAVVMFGVGAFALAQGDSAFNPQDFTSAYSKGVSDAEKGYQANPIDSDANANRNKDDQNSSDKSAETERPTQDILSNRPLQDASGTTAYNVTGNAQLGGVSVAGDGGNGAGSGEGTGNNAGGAVVINPSSNGGEGGSATPGNNAGGGSGNEDNNGGGTSQKPNATTPDGYNIVPTDETPDQKDTPGGGSNDIKFQPINDKNTNMSQVDPAEARVYIAKSFSSEYPLFSGQKLDAWSVFCALDTLYYYNGQSFAWACSKDEFPTYNYFRVDSFPEVVPVGTFDITVSYRFNAQDAWHTETISYEAETSCIYLVSPTLDENGNATVFQRVYGSSCNLLRYTESMLEAAGYSDWGAPTKLLLGWEEDSKPVDYLYNPEPGRHVVTASGFADIPDGLYVSVASTFLDDSLRPTADALNLCYLQRLYGISAADALKEDEEGRTTLEVPEGIQSIDVEAYFGRYDINKLDLPSSLITIDLVATALAVHDQFHVTDDNPFYANGENGILTSKDGTEYLGVPMGLDELVVPENVTKVDLQEGCGTQHIVFQNASALPEINLDALSWCNIQLDDSLLPGFVQEHYAAFNANEGNTVSVASAPNVQLSIDHGIAKTDDTLVYVADTGASTVKVDGPHAVSQGCFDGNNSVHTVVLTDEGDYTFEENSLANSSVSSIVCLTQQQKEHVESQLQQAGAPDAQVSVAATSSEGFRYITTTVDGAPYTMLLTAPATTRAFDGTLTAVDGSTVEVNSISAGTFANCTELAWVILSESVTHIGSDAFSNCFSLQGVFIGATDTVTIEDGAFDGCNSLRFLASRALWGNVTMSDAPNSDCVLYRPTGSDGTSGYCDNFQWFTPESDVVDYAVVAQSDGSYVLYGCDASNPWLVLGSGSELSGEIKLPATTTEIFRSAFKGTQGNFTVNWGDMPNLMYLDGSCFTNSSVAGDVVIGCASTPNVSIASDAFSNCPNITSLTCEAELFDVASWAFSDCTSLTWVKLAGEPSYGLGYSLFAGAFYGCSQLTSIEFSSPEPMDLSLYGSGYGFEFDGDYTNPNEWERIHITVPEGSEWLYLETWLYSFLGYSDFDEYYDAVYWNLYSETMEEPTRGQVKEVMAAGLLDTENHLRQMLGMELVDESSFITIEEIDGYTFQTINGTTTLIEAPADAVDIDIAAVVGNAYESVVLGEGAFAQCSNLQRVVVSGVVSGIEPNAFTNCNGVTVQFTEDECKTVLMGDSTSNPFRFGADIKLVVPEGAEIEYLSTWPMQCVGIVNDWLLGDYFFDVWTALWEQYPDVGPNAEQLNLAVNTPFLEQENYVRGLMGLELIENISDLASYIDCSDMVSSADDDFGSSDDDIWDDPWSDDLQPDSSFDDDLQPDDSLPSENAAAPDGSTPAAA